MWRFFRESPATFLRPGVFPFHYDILYKLNLSADFRVVGITMDKVEETYFLEITQVFSSSAVTDEKELVLTLEDVNTFRSLLDQLNEFQQLLQHVLVGIFTVCV